VELDIIEFIREMLTKKEAEKKEAEEKAAELESVPATELEEA